MKRLIALVSTLLLAALMSACAGPSGPAAAPAARALPDWRMQGSTYYERDFPGLGFSERYESPVGRIDVYVYDMRRRDWVPGIADARFAGHFQSTIADVRTMAERGAYSALVVGPTRDVVVGGQEFRTVSYSFTSNATKMRSATWLTVRNRRLLKYRITLQDSAQLDLDEVATAFIASNLRNDPSTTKAMALAGPLMLSTH